VAGQKRRASKTLGTLARLSKQRAPHLALVYGGVKAGMRDRIPTFDAPASPEPSTSGGHGWCMEAVASDLADALKTTKQTVAISECTSGGLLAASLLSLPGASAYFTGGAVAYSATAREALVPGTHDALIALESARGSGNYANQDRYWESRVVWAVNAARDLQLMCGADWGIAEVGACGPTFHEACGTDVGFVVVAVVGPPVDHGNQPSVGADRVWVRVIETGHNRRGENMWQFAAAAAKLAESCVRETIAADNEQNKLNHDPRWRDALDAALRIVR
jgi:nicotinamide-nucleotide amidase